MIFCNLCKEHWFDKKSGKANIMKCTECEKTIKNTNISCRKFAAKNDMDPYQDGFLHFLQKLFKIEDMLIAHVYPVMKTYWLKGSA
eukprot:240484-Ditylum_brightwellii.AAC.1